MRFFVRRHIRLQYIGVLTLSIVATTGMYVQVARAVDPPTVNTVIIGLTTDATTTVSAVNPNEGTTRTVYILGEVGVPAGCNTLAANGIRSVLYRSSVSGGALCVEDVNQCYTLNQSDSECQVMGCSLGSETVVTYQCTVPLKHYSDPTDIGVYADDTWIAAVYAKDVSDQEGQNTSGTEVNTLTALGLTNEIDYGTLDLGATSTTSTPLFVSNLGNSTIDVALSGTPMSCANEGVLPVSAQHYSVTSETAYEDMHVVSSSLRTVDLSIAKQVSDTPSLGSIYFRLLMPVAGYSGDCSGSHTVVAIDDQ